MDRVMRPGKTDRDKRNGSYARHLENQEKRRRWNQEYAANSKTASARVIPYPVIGF